MMLGSFLKLHTQLPTGIKGYAKRIFQLMLAWLLVYHLVLQPCRLPDKWLTDVTAEVSAACLAKWYSPGFTSRENTGVPGAEITLHGKKAIYIADGCNALELYVVFFGFLLCIPTSIQRTALFAVGGLSLIFWLNISRCCALAWMAVNKPMWFGFAHHYAFTLLVYSCIFAMWVWYGKKYITTDEKG